MAIRHVGFVMDGNRRFSKRLLKDPRKGHEWGAKKLRDVVEWCRDLGVQEVTVYAFSMQNFGRAKVEFDYLMEIFEKTALDMLADDSLLSSGVRARFVGRKHLLPMKVQAAFSRLEELTASNNRYLLNVCVAYGGREEIVDAVQSIAERIMAKELLASDVDEELLSSSMYLAGEPDLIIRTGGDHRTSNFLMWQSPYSEWFFLNKLWPELERADVEKCFSEFEGRERRFGR
jgi:tritrans,polycis-undecaprenyl-diphosphate synthase [geranylgeranyl-diphosphate specific]